MVKTFIKGPPLRPAIKDGHYHVPILADLHFYTVGEIRSVSAGTAAESCKTWHQAAPH